MSDEEKVREAFRLMRRIVEDLGDDGSKIINMMRETEDALREARAQLAERDKRIMRLEEALYYVSHFDNAAAAAVEAVRRRVEAPVHTHAVVEGDRCSCGAMRITGSIFPPQSLRHGESFQGEVWMRLVGANGRIVVEEADDGK